jgi:hypothetical protein
MSLRPRTFLRRFERHLRLLSADNAYSLDRVADMASSVIAACGKASRELDERKPGGLQSGEHWRLWVSRIRTCLKEHGLPAGVRKDRDGNQGQHRSMPWSAVWEMSGRLNNTRQVPAPRGQ